MTQTDTERRQHPRTEIALPVRIQRVTGRTLAGEGSTIDLSIGGARIVGPADFAVGDVVRIAVTAALDGEHQALVVARTAGPSKTTATLHVAFKSLDERTTIDLRRLIGAD